MPRQTIQVRRVALFSICRDNCWDVRQAANTSASDNYALPAAQFKESVGNILVERRSLLSGYSKGCRSADELSQLGLVLIPNILSKTPAYIDSVQPRSPAASAGLKPDDLILFINSQRVASQAALMEELNTIDRGDGVLVMVQRGSELKEVLLQP